MLPNKPLRPTGVARITRNIVIGALALVWFHQAYAAQKLVPTPAEIQSCTIESRPNLGEGTWRPPRVTCKSLTDLLNDAKVVTKERWFHDYSHVAMADTTGILKVRSGSTIRWLLRPGGLGILTFPDGGELYLVSCCSK
jgi:hypothetical protein